MSPLGQYNFQEVVSSPPNNPRYKSCLVQSLVIVLSVCARWQPHAFVLNYLAHSLISASVARQNLCPKVSFAFHRPAILTNSFPFTIFSESELALHFLYIFIAIILLIISSHSLQMLLPFLLHPPLF